MIRGEQYEGRGRDGGTAMTKGSRRKLRRTWEFHDVELELTSMVDVVFLLLVFFMCTMRFRTEEGKMDAFLPRQGPPAPEGKAPPPALHVMIRPAVAGRAALLLDGAYCAGFADFRRKLTARVKLFPKTRVVLDPDANAVHGHVVRALDICRQERVVNVAFRAPVRRRRRVF